MTMMATMMLLAILPMKYASQLNDFDDKTMKTLALLVSSAFVVDVVRRKTRLRM